MAHGVTFVDDDGWVAARCECGWEGHITPGHEDAADSYGDHRADQAVHAAISDLAEPAKPLAIAKFSRRRTFHTDPGGEFVELRVYDGQENLHIDGEYAIYRRTDGPTQEAT